MAKVTPAAGQAIEETTVTRILPDSKTDPERSSSDALEYMDSMTREKWDAGNHIIYLYRVEPILYRGTSGPTYVTKYATPVTLEQIQQEYGGGMWRMVIKRGNERVSDSRYQVSGMPRDLTRAFQEFVPGTPNGVPQTDTNAGITPGGVVSKAMDMVGNTEAQRAQVEMVKSTATDMVTMIRESMPKQLSVQEIIVLAKELAPKANSFLESPLGIALAGKLIDRLFSDPTEQFVKLMDVVGRMNGGSSSSDWKAALVNAAPQLANAVKDTVHELRMGTEAQAQINASRTLQAGPPPPAVAPPAQQNPQDQKVVEISQQPQTGAQPMEPFEMKLVELLNDPKMTGDKAGEILDAQWPQFIDEIAQYSVDQILRAFGTRPLLQPHAKNPRLRQFLTEFLQWANEEDTPPLTATPPAS